MSKMFDRDEGWANGPFSTMQPPKSSWQIHCERLQAQLDSIVKHVAEMKMVAPAPVVVVQTPPAALYLYEAAKQMLEAYTPSYENKWQAENGWGVSSRKDYKQDAEVQQRLKFALEQFEREVKK